MIWKSRREGAGAGCGMVGKDLAESRSDSGSGKKRRNGLSFHIWAHINVYMEYFTWCQIKSSDEAFCAPKCDVGIEKKEVFARETYMSWINTEMRGKQAFLMQIYTRARGMEVVMAKLEEMKARKKCSQCRQSIYQIATTFGERPAVWAVFRERLLISLLQDCSSSPAALKISFWAPLYPFSHFHINRHVGIPTDQHKDGFYSRLDLGLSAFSPFRAITTKNVCRSFLDQVSSGKSSSLHERSDGEERRRERNL